MLTFYYAPQTRATRIYQLLDELGALESVAVETVTVPRRDGTGGRDARNPHPEGKVPTLVHDGEMIWESPAIVLYLTDLFPEAGLGRRPGEKGRGRYLSWLAWYGDVLEPVIHFRFLEIENPGLTNTFRSYDDAMDRLCTALAEAPYLVGDRYTGADLLIASTFLWFPDFVPEDAAFNAWLERCADRPAVKRNLEREQRLMGA
ncbi:glutathione S-transferase family protein [Tropicimonas sp. IMCC6043]|uniref:glutathione S-transferase family protein n=1 Tax=Tropicimonas sp. IMCC6043 TaxID=2510645 RepID=UPI00101DAB23|nr:glutathione S-transferase family protein [Tropicimonas sp. IMCC6043]RYH09945.1 glutathione S-transferase family protein [Tropicimonas sp. IMCC6043]